MRWKQQSVLIHFVDPGAGAGVTSSEVLHAARQAAGRWRAWGVPEIRVVAGDGLAGESEDGVNVIVWRKDWCSRIDPENCFDPKQVAITHARSRVTDPGDKVAEIIEADVEVNGRSPYLSEPAGDRLPRLEQVLTHEFGHVLGLEHNCSASRLSRITDSAGSERPLCAGADRRVREPVMFPGLTEPGLPVLSTPTAGELAGLATLYRPIWLECLSVPWSRSLRCALLAIPSMVYVVLLLRRRARRGTPTSNRRGTAQ